LFIWKSKLSLLKQKRNNMTNLEIIAVIKAQEQELYNDVQKCLETLGAHDPITESVTTRWATINNLLNTLEA